MWRTALRTASRHVGQALRDPEAFVLARERSEVSYGWAVWIGLASTGVLGTASYGMTMGILPGGMALLERALLCTLAASLAWFVALPGIYVLNSLSGSRLSLSSTILAALVTTSWGGLAMIASIPIHWFFSVAWPNPEVVLLVNLVVFTGVGVSMTEIFARVMKVLEPERGAFAVRWLVLVAAIGTPLFHAFDLFQFTNP